MIGNIVLKEEGKRGSLALSEDAVPSLYLRKNRMNIGKLKTLMLKIL